LFTFCAHLKGDFYQTNPIFSNKINGLSFRVALETSDLEIADVRISSHFRPSLSLAASSKARYTPLRRASAVTVPKTGDASAQDPLEPLNGQ